MCRKGLYQTACHLDQYGGNNYPVVPITEAQALCMRTLGKADRRIEQTIGSEIQKSQLTKSTASQKAAAFVRHVKRTVFSLARRVARKFRSLLR